jgi:hypothetical protein
MIRYLHVRTVDGGLYFYGGELVLVRTLVRNSHRYTSVL